MAILRSRRFANRQTEAKSTLIVFTLRTELFALPVQSVVKVTSLGHVYGDPNHQGLGLTVYQGREFLVIDVGQRIFKQPSNLDLNNLPAFLLIATNNSGDWFGIPITSTPALRKVPQSSFKSLPDSYVSHGNIQCVSSIIVEVTDSPPLFLLDPEKLTLFN